MWEEGRGWLGCGRKGGRDREIGLWKDVGGRGREVGLWEDVGGRERVVGMWNLMR
jgi:hypothetical protein